MSIYRIGISGGPAAGKTEIIDLLREDLIFYGKIFIVEEVATYLMKMGIPGGDPSFEVDCLSFQLMIEDWLYDYVSRNYSSDTNIVIIYDRTVFDTFAYATPTEQIKEELLDNYLDRYDIIIHLETAAEHLENLDETNPYRLEQTVGEAVKMDHRTYEYNKLHPNCKFVPYTDDIENKEVQIIDYINELIAGDNE